MYKIEKRDYGLRITASGLFYDQELRIFLEQLKDTLVSIVGSFCVFVDLRDFSPTTELGGELIKNVQGFGKEKGLIRASIIVNNPVFKAQFKRLSAESGVNSIQRYFDSSATPDWEKKALDWLNHGIDPEEEDLRTEEK